MNHMDCYVIKYRCGLSEHYVAYGPHGLVAIQVPGRSLKSGDILFGRMSFRPSWLTADQQTVRVRVWKIRDLIDEVDEFIFAASGC